MGSLCSKSSTHSGGHVVLDSGGTNAPAPSNPQAAAAEAAERRLQEAQRRGTSSSNPKQGQLAAKAGKPAKIVPEPRQEERLVWD